MSRRPEPTEAGGRRLSAFAVAALLALLGLAGCGGDDDDPAVPAPSGGTAPPAAQTAVDACGLVPVEAVASAVGVPPAGLQAQPQPPNPARGAACNYLETARQRIVFVVQARDSTDATQARTLVEGQEGNSVPGVGEAAKYEQFGVGPSQLAFAKGRRVVWLISQSMSVPRQTMVTLAQQAAQKA